jgi:pumilio homology domain family member 6
MRGKMNEIALQHDASRIVQAAIQFGTPAQRKEILIELCANTAEAAEASGSKMEQLPELSKIQYAHFVTLKLIKYCAKDDECVNMMVKSFKGTIPKLAVHSVASRVLEAMFLKFPPKATMSLKQEFYGPHFSLFFTKPSNNNTKVTTTKGSNSTIPTLKSNLELEHTTDAQRKAAMEFVKDLIQRGLTKGFFGFAYFQELVAEYMEVATPTDIRNDMVSSIVDHSLEMLSTRAGAKVVAACASYGTPKDRKRMLKNLKGYTRSSLMHKDAYLAVLQLIQVTDDTVSTQKSLLNELVTVPTKEEEEGAAAAKAAVAAISKQQDVDDEEDDDEMNDQDKKKKKKTKKASLSSSSSSSSPLLELALDNTASKLFLLLLVKEEEARLKYFDTYEQSILVSQPMILEKGQLVPTSKKDPQSRVQELLQHLSPGLAELCSNVENVQQMIQSVPGSRVLKEVYAADLASEAVVEALMKICLAAVQEDNKDEENKSGSLFEDPVGHWLIKNIILYDAQRTDPTQALFSKAFVEQLGDRFMDVAKSNRGAFVVAALLKVPAVQKVVRSKLAPASKNGKQIQKLSKSAPPKKGGDDRKQPPTAGYEALWKELSSKK